MDISNLRAPLRAGTSQYDLDTGICLIDTLHLDASQDIGLRARAEHVHETAHWLTEAMTSIGQLLVFLKCVRDNDLFQAVATNEDVRALFRARLEQGEQGRPIIPNWHLHQTVSLTDTRIDGLLDRWAGSFRTEVALLHGSKLPITFEDRVWHLAAAIEFYADRLNDDDLLDNRSFGARHTDAFARNSGIRHLSFADSIEANVVCETVDLIEAIAVCAEVLWAHRVGVFGDYAPHRIRELAGSTYAAPLQQILAEIGEDLSAEAILRNAKVLLIVLECALNPPIPPIERFDYAAFDWTHLFPPLRFNKGLQHMRRPGVIDGLRFDQTYDEATDGRLHAALYAAMDPPGRDFRVNIVETNDFAVFRELPQRAPLENMFVWTTDRRVLLPYHLRLWSAGQLRVSLLRGEVHALSEAILAPDLSRVTRHCNPVLTLRARALARGSKVVPATTQFLATQELLEWFLVNSGIQYVGADFMAGSGAPDYAGFLSGSGFSETAWVPEIRRTAEAAFLGSLKFS